MLYVYIFLCMHAFICVYIFTHTCAVFLLHNKDLVNVRKVNIISPLIWVPSQTYIKHKINLCLSICACVLRCIRHFTTLWTVLIQGIFLTQGSNLRLLHCRQILYHWAIREAHIWAYLNQNHGVVFVPFFFITPMSIRKSCFIYSQNSILLTFTSFHLLSYNSSRNHYYLHMDFHSRIPAVLSGSTFHHSPDNPFFTLPE